MEQNHVRILKSAINLLFVVISGATAFLFTAYGLAYKNIDFIAEYFTLLLWLAFSVISVITIAGIVFYVLKKQTLYRLFVCILICLDLFSVIFFTLCATEIIGKINSVQALRETIEQAGGTAVFVYIAFCFLQVVLLPVPGSVAVAVGVAMFGPLKCIFYSFIGIVTGSFVAFAVGRWIGYRAVCWICGKESLDKWLKKLKGKDYLILSIMFLLPLFPDDVLCFIAGLSSMTTGYFLVMITITRLISVVTTAYSFELIPFTEWWGILIWVLLIGLVILLFVLVCRYSDKIDKFIKNKLHFGKSE